MGVDFGGLVRPVRHDQAGRDVMWRMASIVSGLAFFLSTCFPDLNSTTFWRFEWRSKEASYGLSGCWLDKPPIPFRPFFFFLAAVVDRFSDCMDLIDGVGDISTLGSG